ncbi:MAG: HAD family phosphatase [Faecalibacterium prausnitzii]|nr:HAD family phosphatase [Faecalibacterium prausnitzii]
MVYWKKTVYSEQNEDYSMYKSIVFDLGGVMVDFDPKSYLVDLLCNAAMEEKVYELTFGSEEWKLMDAGLISRFEGNKRMLERAQQEGCSFEVQGVLDDWIHILHVRHRMQELVRRMKNHGYCVYYLSNIPQDVLDLLRQRGVLDRFDGGVASCEVHINKPDPRIYQALLDKYHLKAEECVFIDDRPENVQTAFSMGFAGVQMKDSVGTLVRSLATCNVSLR